MRSWKARGAGLALIVAVSQGVDAAEITQLNAAEADYALAARGACTFQLRGEIAAGDAARLQALLEERFPRTHDELSAVICLDSPGGSLDEGVRLAELFGRYPVSTVVPAGADCLSACAVAFMGGSFGWYEYLFNMRHMHPAARIGFHAPALEVADGDYDAGSVKAAFGVAVEAIARIAGDLDTVPHSSTVNRFPRSLLAEMLKHKGEDYLWIETVEQAGVWDIGVITAAAPAVSPDGLVVACKAATRWLKDDPRFDFARNDWDLDGDTDAVEKTGETAWRLRYSALFETTCEAEVTDGRTLSLTINHDGVEAGQMYLPIWVLYGPQKRLAEF
ncbi:hypothetical protein JYP51_09940 [Ponticoccus gilvus]|nr:hypothetical protein [Enemella evansiae]